MAKSKSTEHTPIATILVMGVESQMISAPTQRSFEKALIDATANKKILIVTDETVAKHHLATCLRLFDKNKVHVVVHEAGESHKNQTSLNLIYDALIEHSYHRDAILVALGGGVVSDLTGFAAATYMRGIDWVAIPTTLMAQIDASIGGKTAVNYRTIKNGIGAFYQPKQVILHPPFLDTLERRQYRQALGELIKYAILIGGSFYQRLQVDIKSLGASCEPDKLIDYIHASVQYKASVVNADPFEKSQTRMILNLGHTIAHALESATDFEAYYHGEAVAIGLHCAAILSHLKGMLARARVDEIKQMIREARLPYQIPKRISLDALMSKLKLDKKSLNGKLRFILIRDIKDCFVCPDVEGSDIKQMYHLALEGEENE